MKGWKAILGQIAPTIATALGGPLAGGAVRKLSEAVLGRADATEQDLAAEILKSDPATFERVKAAELEYAKFIAEHEIELEKLAVDDRASARSREVSLRDRMPMLLGLLVTLGFFGLLGSMLVVRAPVENVQALNIMLGSLASAFVGVVTYYFGSSAGSSRKTELMAAKNGDG